jgi:enamine deaminase RidA (YjgF/YER057c/UK114 family)
VLAFRLTSFCAQVINGFSDTIAEVFGKEIGQHARTSVGVNALPLNVPCEIEAIVRFK